MMNKNAITLSVPKPRTRAHFVLFCENTPFKPKRVENKRAYSRKQKHSKSQQAY